MITERESMTLNEMGARALGVEERSDETPRARASGARPAPDPEVIARPKRRQFTAEYRLRILEEADRCTQPGEVGRLLRREGLYTSHLSAWRKARRQGSLRGLTPNKRGAKPAERNPLGAKVRGHREGVDEHQPAPQAGRNAGDELHRLRGPDGPRDPRNRSEHPDQRARLLRIAGVVEDAPVAGGTRGRAACAHVIVPKTLATTCSLPGTSAC